MEGLACVATRLSKIRLTIVEEGLLAHVSAAAVTHGSLLRDVTHWTAEMIFLPFLQLSARLCRTCPARAEIMYQSISLP
jgi:hypothetical protein